jgi:hypothetical protein
MSETDTTGCGYEPGHLYLLKHTGWLDGPFLVLRIELWGAYQPCSFHVHILTAQGEFMKFQSTFCVGGEPPYGFEKVS